MLSLYFSCLCNIPGAFHNIKPVLQIYTTMTQEEKIADKIQSYVTQKKY